MYLWDILCYVSVIYICMYVYYDKLCPFSHFVNIYIFGLLDIFILKFWYFFSLVIWGKYVITLNFQNVTPFGICLESPILPLVYSELICIWMYTCTSDSIGLSGRLNRSALLQNINWIQQTCWTPKCCSLHFRNMTGIEHF